MNTTIRKAVPGDIPGIAEIYERIHTEEEEGRVSIGWVRGVYPTEETAYAALERGDLFVEIDEESGEERLVATAIINQTQVPEYDDCTWAYAADPSEIMVLHTLVVDPTCAGRGYGKAFVRFYEAYALEHGCHYLRMDTQAKNTGARAMYRKLGFSEPGIVPCCFNGIAGVQLVCLEKLI